MSPPKTPAALESEPTSRGGGDPWQAFAYVVSGVVIYGLGGWLLDRWWGTSLMVVVGILVGAALGIYMTFGRYGRTPTPAPAAGESTAPPLPSRREH